MSQLPGRARSDDDDDDDVRYLDLDGLARYSGLGVSTLKRFVRDRAHPLPHLQVRADGKERGRLLFRKDEFDAWMDQFKSTPVAKGAAGADDLSWIKVHD